MEPQIEPLGGAFILVVLQLLRFELKREGSISASPKPGITETGRPDNLSGKFTESILKRVKSAIIVATLVWCGVRWKKRFEKLAGKRSHGIRSCEACCSKFIDMCRVCLIHQF